MASSLTSRGDWIRTSDHLHPMQVRYRAALHPEIPCPAFRSDHPATLSGAKGRRDALPGCATPVTGREGNQRLPTGIDWVSEFHPTPVFPGLVPGPQGLLSR